jgi:hypothetical protein
VDRENLQYETQYERSLATKTYILACVNSYLGLLGTIFIDKSFYNLTLLLGTILMFKQVILNLREWLEPLKAFKKKFEAH